MDKKLRISKMLMYLSVLLIVLFQAYWLRQVYRNNFFNLRREISVVMRESFVREQMMVLFSDSTQRFIQRDSLQRGNGGTAVRIAIPDRKDGAWNGRDTVRFDFSFVSKSDSSNHNERGRSRFMAFESRDDRGEELKKMIVTLPVNPKNLEDSSLQRKYVDILKKAGLPFKFTTSKHKPGSEDSIRMRQPNIGGMGMGNRGGMPFGFGNNLQLTDFDFGKPLGHILGKMYGPIGISLVMTTIIILAFRFMYRNLREQQKLAIQKNAFISNMTHELKTPVATVSVAIEALKNFSVMDDPARTQEYLNISSAELNRLNLLIDKVLRINMFEAQKLELDHMPVDIGRLTTEVIQAQQLQAEKLKAVIHWDQPETPMMIKGDRLHLMSVLYNLLDNSLKYRSANPEIRVELSRKADEVFWTIRDNGPGIAAEYRQKVFEKFFRVPNGDRHDVKGYGLGLSYVNEVVQNHGGSIAVESEPGKGCTFTIVLPAIS